MSEGMEDMSERYHLAGGESSGIVGYCFYHRQDMECALAAQELLLAFGDIRGGTRKGVMVGKRIRTSLERVGLAVAWSGEINKRLIIKPFHWQRRLATA